VYAFGCKRVVHVKVGLMSTNDATPKTFQPSPVSQTTGPPLSPWHAVAEEPAFGPIQMLVESGLMVLLLGHAHFSRQS